VTRCQHCGRSTPTPVRTVLQARPKTYPPRPKANTFRRWVRDQGKWKHKRILRDDPGGVGWEVVREGMFCPGCAGEFAEGFG
jgi:hypothetical protein